MFGKKQPKLNHSNLADLGKERVTFSMLTPQESKAGPQRNPRPKSKQYVIPEGLKQAKQLYHSMSNLVQLHKDIDEMSPNNQKDSSSQATDGRNQAKVISPKQSAAQSKKLLTKSFQLDKDALALRKVQNSNPYNRRKDQLLAGCSPLITDNYENVRNFLQTEKREKHAVAAMTGIIRSMDAQRQAAANWNNQLRPTSQDPHVKGSVNPLLTYIKGDMQMSTNIGHNRRKSVIVKQMPKHKKGNLSISESSQGFSKAKLDRFKLAEKNLSLDYITEVDVKQRYLGQISQLMDFIETRLKVTFGLFTQEKNDLFFKELQNMIDIVFYEMRPLPLIIAVGKLIITVMYQYTEYYKCTWCCRRLIKLTEQSLLFTAARKREFESIVKLRIENKARKLAGELPKFAQPLEYPYQAQIIFKSEDNLEILKALLDLYKTNADSLHYTMQFDESLQSAYKMLFLALYLKEEIYELQSYDILSREYNEVGDYCRSKYFQEKYKDTYIEDPDSISRRVYPEMRRRYNISKMGINDSVADIRDDSPDTNFYENIPLNNLTILVGFQDKRNEGFFLPFDEIRKTQPFTHPRLENRVRIATKKVKYKNKIGKITQYSKISSLGSSLAKAAKLKFTNCTETALLTHKSPNRTLLNYNDHSDLRGQDVFKRQYLEVVLKDKAIMPIIDEYNRCGLLLQAAKEDLKVLKEASKLIDYSAFE